MTEPYLTEVKPFYNVELPSAFEQLTNLLFAQGNQQIGNLENLAVGMGNTGMFVNPGTTIGSSPQVGGLWLGNQKMASAPFSVDMNGNLIATKAAVSGAITAASIDIGSGNNSFHVDTNGNLWIGNAVFASAPFSVTNGGALKATSGAIGGWSIGATTLTSGGITLDAGNQQISGGTVTGATIIINHQGGGGDPGTGAFLRWTGGSRMWEDNVGGLGMDCIGTEGIFFYVHENPTARFVINNSGQNSLYGGVFIHNDGTTGNVNIEGDVAMNNLRLNQTITEGNITGVDIVKGFNDLRFQTGDDSGTNHYFRFLDHNGNVKCYIDTSDGTFHTGSI